MGRRPGLPEVRDVDGEGSGGGGGHWLWREPRAQRGRVLGAEGAGGGHWLRREPRAQRGRVLCAEGAEGAGSPAVGPCGPLGAMDPGELSEWATWVDGFRPSGLRAVGPSRLRAVGPSGRRAAEPTGTVGTGRTTPGLRHQRADEPKRTEAPKHRCADACQADRTALLGP